MFQTKNNAISIAFTIVLCFCIQTVKATIRYVKPGNAGTAPYTSWATASNDLQAVINASSNGDQVWVAAGTYIPNRLPSTGAVSTSRDICFLLKAGVSIYGGFTGTETLLSERNHLTNITTLSGEIGSVLLSTDNCYHVVIAAGAACSGLLDGFTITLGHAEVNLGLITVNSQTIIGSRGAGIYITASSPTIQNCIISGNKALNGIDIGGAGVMVSSTASPVFNNCSFTNNIAANGSGSNVCGAGMYWAATSGTINTCSFLDNNSGSQGGGINISADAAPDIINCSFQNNSATINGGGVANNSGNANFSNCTFTSNTADYGAGMYNQGASPVVTGCSFFSNTATSGGGGIRNWANASPIITNCIISGNTGGFYGGGMYNSSTSSPTITNCLVSGNTANNGGGIAIDNTSETTIRNSTIVSNKVSTNGGGLYSNGASFSLYNTIVWGNETNASTLSSVYTTGTGDYTADYCIIEGGFPGGSYITDAAPLFISALAASTAPATGGDYRLQNCSPAINKGSNTFIPSGIASDLDGNKRIAYQRVDIGVYEKQNLVAVLPDANGIIYVDETKNGNGSSWGNAVAELSDALMAAGENNAITQIWVAKGTYHPGYAAPDSINPFCNPSSNRYNSFKLVKNVKLYGGFAGGETSINNRDFINNETILSGDFNNDDVVSGSGNTLSISNNTENAYHVLLSAGDAGTAEIDGFTIRSGKSTDEPGIFYVNNVEIISYAAGAGMHICSSSPVIRNCTFMNNSANEGGGIQISYNATPIISNSSFVRNATIFDGAGLNSGFSNTYWTVYYTLTDCIFSGNRARYGAGIFNAGAYTSSSINISGCTFTGNSAYSGAGIYNSQYASPHINNCTFNSNSASIFGGGILNTLKSSPQITACAFTENAAQHGGGIYNTEDSLTQITYCNFTGNTSSSGAGAYFNTSAFPTISNCSFNGNKAAANGGAVCNVGSQLSISHCSFKGNEANQNGGGMYNINNSNNGSPTITNSIFTGNTAALYGGGISNENGISPVMLNCTIAGNRAANGGAVSNRRGVYTSAVTSSTLKNCIVWGNSSGIDGSDSATVTNTIVEGGYPGSNVLNADPVFVSAESSANAPTTAGDYHITVCSPAANTGNNTYVIGTITLDLDSNARIAFNTADMGVYELQTEAAPDVNFTGLAGSYCAGSSPVTLTGIPAGGTFSGTGISDNGNGTAFFDPMLAGAGGPYSITYSYSFSGCIKSSTQQVTVRALPSASFTAQSNTVCEGSSTNLLLNFTGSAPWTYSINGLITATTSSSSVSIPVSPATDSVFELTTLTDAHCSANSWREIAVGGLHMIGLKTNGTLWAWGGNFSGQLGVNDLVDRLKPVQVGTSADWLKIATGEAFSVALQKDGSLWTWGSNFYKELGLNSTDLYKNTPQKILTSSGYKAITAGEKFGMAIKNDGSIWGWGLNIYGYLGNGSTTGYEIPTQTITGNWTSIAAGQEHSLGLKPDGTLWSWGKGTTGQLGRNVSVVSNLIPGQVGSSNNWMAIEAGADNSFGIMNDGTLWGWGWNQWGELGTGDFFQQDSPQQAGTSTDWKSVALSNSSAVAIKQQGTLWGTGLNNHGQLGNGGTLTQFGFAQSGTDNNWVQVAGGGSSGAAVKSDGTLWTWGRNGSGQLGDGTTADRLAPVQVNTPISSVTITVNPLPEVSITGLPAIVCQGASPLTLTGNPAGGIFSGPGITGNIFDPFTLLTNQPYTITYTYSDGICSNSISQQVTVKPVPGVYFLGLNANVCADAGPILLTGVPAGGTFSGPGINGNYFNPDQVPAGWPYLVRYDYTDPATGCSGSFTRRVTVDIAPTVSITGNHYICSGNGTTLTATIGPESGIVGIFQWAVTDGNGTTNLGTTDTQYATSEGNYTVSVTNTSGCSATSPIFPVSAITLPAINFTGLAPTYCSNDIPVLLTGSLYGDPSAGFFTGPGITDNGNGTATFNPAIAGIGGPFTITYNYSGETNTGCLTSSTQTVTITNCGTVTVQAKLFLQGYYLGAGIMQEALLNEEYPGAVAMESDSITVELYDALTYELVESKKTILYTNGLLSLNFAHPPGNYYLAVKHRNSVQTWSAVPITCSNGMPVYDFTTAADKAYGNNMIEVEPGTWAFYSGDINQDGAIDGLDMNYIDNNVGFFGYSDSDINGDGATDGLDMNYIDNNSQLGIFYAQP